MPEELTLLPCPACGEEAHILDAFERDDKGHVIVGWIAQCTRGCLTTSERDSREEAATSWNALLRALMWKDEPPKVPGWYWHRCEEGVVTMRRVWKGDIETLSKISQQWAGPISEPREPKA